jgi:thiol-disulfide isomerase/thioredoxin
MMKNLVCFFALLVLISCDSGVRNKKLSEGKWRAEIAMQGQILPFNFEVIAQGDSQMIYLVNGKEKLPVSQVAYTQDSVKISMPFYDCEIVGTTDGKTFEGAYIKRFPDKEYRLPMTAILGKTHRFETKVSTNTANFSSKWSVSFIEENGDSTQAVGIFAQDKEQLEGTFLTTTGDYRFLAGEVEENNLNLSCFDGEHAFLFKAKQTHEDTLQGTFWSGSAYKARWVAHRNPNAALPNPDSLTFLKDGYDQINFTFPDLNGNDVSLDNEKYKGKVVIVQILGSWCPNCMDETAFLSKYYEANKGKPIAILGLAYERNPEFNEAKKRLEKMKIRFEIGYDLLIAGAYHKAAAAASLPMLNHVMAFPTTIFIDKKGRVRKIHTGFNGPGTGDYYEKFVEEFNIFMDKLLKEEA